MKFLKLIIVGLIFVSCQHTGDTYNKLQQIDAMLYEEKDSVAYSLLNSIKSEDLNDGDKTMYFNLLKTALLYRMGKNEENDTLINACISYYDNEGNKEKLSMAYYYRALVFWEHCDENVLLDLKRAETFAEMTQNFRIWFGLVWIGLVWLDINLTICRP